MENDLINELILSLKRIIHHETVIDIPSFGEKSTVPLKSSNYYFTLDINRSGHKKQKVTFQLRENSHKTDPLIRLDVIGRSHPNPPGDYDLADRIIECPHIHFASSEYGLAIAYPLDHPIVRMNLTPNVLEDLGETLKIFMDRINVANIDSYDYNYNVEIL